MNRTAEAGITKNTHGSVEEASPRLHRILHAVVADPSGGTRGELKALHRNIHS